MAATIDVSCPKCGHRSRAPATMQGKNARCKLCQTVFVVKSPGKVEAKRGAGLDDDEEIAKNPYGVVAENLAARCPHCALPLDPPDARICLHCGYDMQKRKRVESKKIYERTAADYILYHLPTIGCLIVIAILIAVNVLALIFRHDIMKDSWFDNGDGTYLVKPGIIPLYVFLATMILGIAPCATLIFYRLIRFSPPEVEKKDKAD